MVGHLADKILLPLTFLLLLILFSCQYRSRVEALPAKLRFQLEVLRNRSSVWMSTVEQELIESFLRPNMVMLEWGSGYSTVWFAQFVKEYYSIEHNISWYDRIHPFVSKIPSIKGYLLVEPNVPTWRGDGTFAEFSDYVHAVQRFHVKKYDAVLIDGRARVSCALQVLPYLSPSSVVFFHDYYARKNYHAIIPNYTVISSVFEGQTLVVVKPLLVTTFP